MVISYLSLVRTCFQSNRDPNPNQTEAMDRAEQHQLNKNPLSRTRQSGNTKETIGSKFPQLQTPKKNQTP